MTRCIAIAAVLVLLVPAVGQAEPFVYSFTATDQNTGQPYSFSFREPSMITTTGAFSFTPFTINNVTFSFGLFDSSTDCFEFLAGSGATACKGVIAHQPFFFADHPGATAPGTYLAELPVAGNGPPWVRLSSLTITQVPVPEPNSFLLLATAVTALGMLRQKLRA